ncbi:MAG: response regulator [Pseudomonadota bacterium]
MAEGGALRIVLGDSQRDGKPHVCICVSDTGEGMDPQTVGQIFEPYYTTKAIGRGTGLGMSIVQQLAQEAGGFVEVQSTLGSGTTIRVKLPLVPAPETADMSEPAETAPSSGARLEGVDVLVVEDDAEVAGLVNQVLERVGAQFRKALSGAEALAMLESSQPDLMLIDVVMAEMSGPACVAAARARGVDCPVLYMSGSSDRQLVEHGIDLNSDVVLRKPYRVDALIEALDRILRSGVSSK